MGSAIALFLHSLDLNRAEAADVRDRSTGHTGKKQGDDNIDLSRIALLSFHQAAGKFKRAIRLAKLVDQQAEKNEQRDREH